MREKVDILLIQPPYPELAFETTNIPLGLAWISAVLKREGFKTIGYDQQIEGQDVNKLKKIIEEVQPKIIGVDFHAQVSFNHSMDVVKYLKKDFPEIVVIAGGQQATFRPEPILTEGQVSYVVLGEGEFIVVDLVKYILNLPGAKTPEEIPSLMYQKNGQIVTNERAPRIKDLDSLPLPDRDAFDWKRYPQWVIITSRGCPYRCAFCSSKSFWGKTTRYRSADNVLAEMDQLVNKYGITDIAILDDTFTLKKSRVMEICQGIIERKLPVKWACGTRTDQIDEEMLSIMKKAGCAQISFGLESANQATLDLIQKDVSVEQQRQGILMAKSVGLHTRVSVMLGLPGESPKEIRNTLNLLLETEPNEIQLYPIMPYDGTGFSEDREHFGIAVCNTNFSDWKKDSLAPVAQSQHLSSQQITQMACEMVDKLSEQGYTHMTGKEETTKKNLDKVVSTGLTAYQRIESAKVEKR